MVAIAFGFAAVRRALRHSEPIIDLAAARIPTFALSTLSAGFLARIAISTTPFLLPLMFQIGLGECAFEAGLMLVVYMAGNLAMKSATTAILHRFAFRRVILLNGVLCVADVQESLRASATTLAAIAQQAAGAVAVAVGTLSLGLFQLQRAGSQLVLEDFQRSLFVAAGLMAASVLWSLRLEKRAGAELSAGSAR
jgi:hypothetical protein